MGLSVFPTPSGGGIKSVQRGLASGAGNVTITAVDISKSFVTVFGTTSSGTVAATGALSGATGTASAGSGNLASGSISGSTIGVQNTGGGTAGMGRDIYGAPLFGTMTAGARNFNTNATNISLNATNISGGSNNLVSAVVQGFLANSTTLTVSGACRYEVVEFN
jgi:hypothetical protein